MKIEVSEEAKAALREVLPRWSLSDRELVWLWLVMSEDRLAPNLSQSDFMDDRSWYDIADYIRSENLCFSLTRRKSITIIPTDRLDWINGKPRQSRWLLSSMRLLYRNQNTRTPMPPVHLNERQELIGMIDFIDLDIETKTRELSDIQRDWNKFTHNDHYYRWFTTDKKTESEKIDAAWLWHNKQRSLFNVPKFESLEDLLIYHYNSRLSQDETLYHIDSIKKQFKNNQVKKNNKNKKQTNLSLSKEARKQLDKLTVKYGKGMTAIVEELIAHAYRNGLSAQPSSEAPSPDGVSDQKTEYPY